MVLERETVITKWDKKQLPKVINACYKVHQVLQSVTEVYYKTRQVLKSVTDHYYEVRQVLQSVIGCYYKVRQVLQSLAVITKWDVTPVIVVSLHCHIFCTIFHQNGKFFSKKIFLQTTDHILFS